MARAKQHIPFELKSLKHNTKTGLYDITEDGITYSMNLETVRSMSEHFKDFNATKKITSWYKDLDRFTKKGIVVTGKAEQADTFYPD